MHIHVADAADHAVARTWIGKLADQRIPSADAVRFAVMVARGCRGFPGFDRDVDLAGFLRRQP